MSELAMRLKDLQEAGVYQLNCSLSELRAVAQQAGFTLFDVDLSVAHSKSEWLAAVADTLHAPTFFGNNWDALADALGDLSWHSAAGYVLVLRNAGADWSLRADEQAIAAEILHQTVDFWRTQGKAFWIFCC